jgi:hypothetical protein
MNLLGHFVLRNDHIDEVDQSTLVVLEAQVDHVIVDSPLLKVGSLPNQHYQLETAKNLD